MTVSPMLINAVQIHMSLTTFSRCNKRVVNTKMQIKKRIKIGGGICKQGKNRHAQIAH